MAYDKEAQKRFYEKHKERLLEKKRSYKAEWYKLNQERLQKKAIVNGRLYKQRNPDKHCAYQARRRAAKLRATPIWLTQEQKNQIMIEYNLAKWCSSVMGTKYHVDHIIPLKGKDVCGLHVPWNLQVIQAKQNLSKGNRIVI
jgi:5-methylcytosine-specific restriction endonuclease McrA